MAGFKYVSGSVISAGAAGDALHGGGAVTGDHVIHGRALYVGTGGDVGIMTQRGQNIQFNNVPSGTLLEVAHQKVYGATGHASDTPATTATGLVSLI